MDIEQTKVIGTDGLAELARWGCTDPNCGKPHPHFGELFLNCPKHPHETKFHLSVHSNLPGILCIMCTQCNGEVMAYLSLGNESSDT